jgi:hypothetical protein
MILAARGILIRCALRGEGIRAMTKLFSRNQFPCVVPLEDS